MIKLAIADDEALFRKGMRQLISDFDEMDVVLEAGNGEELLEHLATADTSPDALLLDLKMPGLNGIETAKILQADYSSIRVIVLSTFFSKAFIINMIELGASAYLAKNSLPEEVEATIREVCTKGFSYNQKVMEVIRDNMIQKTKPRIKTPFGVELTRREREILQLICEEYT
ncbi:MAG: response regulator transcription factor, partial [Bacteroidota bacterium]